MGDRMPVHHDDHALADHEIDHVMVARIVRRATELAGPMIAADGRPGISRDALVAAAQEVGIPAVVVLRSIALERLGPEPVPRVADRLVGAAIVVVDDEIAGSAEEVLGRIDAWLVAGHHLRRDRVRNGRGEWSKRSGVVGVTVRRLRVATGEGRLGEFRQVTAAAEDIGTGSAVVRVTVDRSNSRRMAIAGGATAALGGAGGIVAAAALGPLALVAAPVVAIGGVAVARSGRNRARRAVNELERMLEAVADHQPPTKLRHEVARRVIGRASHPPRPATPG
jgi:hypothetical protein